MDGELTNDAVNITPVKLDTTPVKLDKEGNVDLTNISPDEVKKYGEMARVIDPKDVNSILNYGTEVQASMEK